MCAAGSGVLPLLRPQGASDACALGTFGSTSNVCVAVAAGQCVVRTTFICKHGTKPIGRSHWGGNTNGDLGGVGGHPLELSLSAATLARVLGLGRRAG